MRSFLDTTAQYLLTVILQFIRSLLLAIRTPGGIVRSITAHDARDKLLQPIAFAILSYVLFTLIWDTFFNLPSGDQRLRSWTFNIANVVTSPEKMLVNALPLVFWISFIGWIAASIFNRSLQKSIGDMHDFIDEKLTRKSWVNLVFFLSGLHFSVISALIFLQYIYVQTFRPEGDLHFLFFLAIAAFVIVIDTFELPRRMAPQIARAGGKKLNSKHRIWGGFYGATICFMFCLGYIVLVFLSVFNDNVFVNIISSGHDKDSNLHLELLVTNKSEKYNLIYPGDTLSIDFGSCGQIRNQDSISNSLFNLYDLENSVFGSASISGQRNSNAFYIAPGETKQVSVRWKGEEGIDHSIDDIVKLKNCIDDTCCCRVRMDFLQPATTRAKSQWRVCRPQLPIVENADNKLSLRALEDRINENIVLTIYEVVTKNNKAALSLLIENQSDHSFFVYEEISIKTIDSSSVGASRVKQGMPISDIMETMDIFEKLRDIFSEEHQVGTKNLITTLDGFYFNLKLTMSNDTTIQDNLILPGEKRFFHYQGDLNDHSLIDGKLVGEIYLPIAILGDKGSIEYGSIKRKLRSVFEDLNRNLEQAKDNYDEEIDLQIKEGKKQLEQKIRDHKKPDNQN